MNNTKPDPTAITKSITLFGALKQTHSGSGTTNATEVVVKCANMIGEWPDEGESIVLCALNQGESDTHLATMKRQSDAAQVNKVPFVQINGARNERADTDFFIEICNSFTVCFEKKIILSKTLILI